MRNSIAFRCASPGCGHCVAAFVSWCRLWRARAPHELGALSCFCCLMRAFGARFCGVSAAKCFLLPARPIFAWGFAAPCGFLCPLCPSSAPRALRCLHPSVCSHPRVPTPINSRAASAAPLPRAPHRSRAFLSRLAALFCSPLSTHAHGGTALRTDAQRRAERGRQSRHVA